MDEKKYLRELAGRYAEIAHSKVMDERREKWRIHNRLETRTFPFHIEDNGTFFKDLMPNMKCEDEANRDLEFRLVHLITTFEKINDDRILPDRFVVSWARNLTSWCPELSIKRADSGAGKIRGYESNKPIKDLDKDLNKYKKRTMTIDREKTHQKAESIREIFDGLLPVEIGNPGSLYSDGFTNKAVHLLGMQELFLQMAVNPEGVHRLYDIIVEDILALGQQEEDEHLLTLNTDGNQGYCSGSSQYTDEIPHREVTPETPLRSDERYGYLESQESTGISPDMFNEFVMPHSLKLAKKFKLMKWGCCEPAHDIIEHLQKLNGLRKVSVTPWCDQEKLATRCHKDIIWCRKPVPLKLCSEKFDPNELREHLQETLDIGKDFFVEFVFRDTCMLTGAMEKRLAQACDIVRKITNSPAGSK